MEKKTTNKHSQDGVTLFFGGEGGAGRDGTVVLSEHRSLLGCAAPVWSTRVQGVLQVCKGCCKCAMGCYKCAQGCMCVCTVGVHGAVGVCTGLWVCRCPCSGMPHARGLHLATPQAQQGCVTCTLRDLGTREPRGALKSLGLERARSCGSSEQEPTWAG